MARLDILVYPSPGFIVLLKKGKEEELLSQRQLYRNIHILLGLLFPTHFFKSYAFIEPSLSIAGIQCQCRIVALDSLLILTKAVQAISSHMPGHGMLRIRG